MTMKRIVGLLLAGALSCWTTVALAQDATSVKSGDALTKDTYPIEQLKRPLTLLRNMGEPRLAFFSNKTSGVDLSLNMGIEFNYGIINPLQVGLRIPFHLKPTDNAIYEFDINAQYNIIKQLNASLDLIVGKPGGRALDEWKFGLGLGLPFKFAFGDYVGLVGFEQIVRMMFVSGAIKANTTLAFPVGVLVQPLARLALRLEVEPMLPGIEPDAFGMDVDFAVQYSFLRQLDVGLFYANALVQAKEIYGKSHTFGLFAAFRF